MQVFAVQTMEKDNRTPHFVLVQAKHHEQALDLAGQQAIDAGKAKPIIVAVFSMKELEGLVEAGREMEKSFVD